MVTVTRYGWQQLMVESWLSQSSIMTENSSYMALRTVHIWHWQQSLKALRHIQYAVIPLNIPMKCARRTYHKISKYHLAYPVADWAMIYHFTAVLGLVKGVPIGGFPQYQAGGVFQYRSFFWLRYTHGFTRNAVKLRIFPWTLIAN